MKTQKIVVVLALVLGLATTVQGEEYWLETAVANPISVPANWTNSVGVAPSVINSDDILHIEKNLSLILATKAGGVVTHGGAFHIGADDGSTSATIWLQNDVDLNNIRWHSGAIVGYSGSEIFEVTGNATLDNPSAEHRVAFSASKSWAGIVLNANLSCSDADIAIRCNPAPKLREQSLLVFGGDNSAYIGKIRQDTATVPFVLASANALGSPTTACADALSVESANAVLSVKSGITPNDKRGITISASGFCICATNYVYSDSTATPYQDCSSFELPMPIAGDYGFTKTGPGTVTLSGDYTAGDIAIENGTLDITSSAEFPAGQNISVASGAALYVHQPLSRFNITAAEGATVEYVLDTLEVTYDDSEHTATALTRGSSFSVPEGVKQPIALSSAISLPLHTALHLEVLTVASGAAPLSADDFTDETPKTFGLPKTSFEVTTDGAGVQHVYLNVRPVIESIAIFTNTGNNSLNSSSNCWFNGEEAQPGYDYLVTNQIARIPATSFNGGSLTIANAAESGDPMNLYTRGNGTLDAVIYAGACGVNIEQNTKNGGGCFTTSGNLYIAGDYDDSGYVRFSSKYCPTSDTGAEWISYGSYWHRLSANLSGEGPLMLYAANSTTATKGNPQLYGDNSAYKGKIYVTYTGSNKYLADGVGVALTFNSANALGGALDEFKYDSLTLDKYSVLRPATSMEFSTENRGIYGSGPFGFDITNGVTFKVGVPVRMKNEMYKHGGGDLLLGGAISFGANGTGASGTCYVRAGGIGALSDAAVAGLDMVFSNGTKIVIAPEATLVNGFTGVSGVSFEPSDATVSVGVADASAISGCENYEFVIATIPTSEGDLSSHFALGSLKGYTGTIEKESVVVDEVPCTRYIAKYVHKGLTISFR